jgi:hypothetical protein
VTGHSRIRFFAGTPLLSETGEAVGVLAVFDSEPRQSFSTADRRALLDLGAVTMSELTALATRAARKKERRSTLHMYRDSLISSIRPESPTSVYSNGDYSDPDTVRYSIMPAALSIQKSPDIGQHQLQPFVEDATEGYISDPGLTSPESDESDVESLRNKRYSRGMQKLMRTSSRRMVRDSVPRTPDTVEFISTLPRRGSIPDLTTNGRCRSDSAQTIVPLFGDDRVGTGPLNSSNMDLDTSQTSTASVALATNNNNMLPLNALASVTASATAPRSVSFGNVLVMPRSFSHPEQGMKLASRANLSSVSSKPRRFDIDPCAEATFALELWCRNLGYDAMYAVELRPSRPQMTTEELLAPNGLNFNLLVSFGFDGAITFDPKWHLGVIRSDDPRYMDGHSGKKIDGWAEAYLFPIRHDGAATQHRTRGTVFAAYRKFSQGGGIFKPTSEVDYERLMDAALALTDILYKPSPREPQPAKVETNLPTITYHGNSSSEIANLSLEASLSRALNNIQL